MNSEKSSLEKKIEFDQAITEGYNICDIKAPILGHICDKLSYDDEHVAWKILGYIMLAFVIIVDIVLDIVFVVLQIGGGAVAGIPIVGSVLGAIDALEIDDILDAISLVIIFIFCGPASGILAGMVAYFEFSEGVLEIVPWWTIVIVFWWFFIKPARKRMIEMEKRGVVDDDIEQPKLKKAKDLYEI